MCVFVGRTQWWAEPSQRTMCDFCFVELPLRFSPARFRVYPNTKEFKLVSLASFFHLNSHGAEKKSSESIKYSSVKRLQGKSMQTTYVWVCVCAIYWLFKYIETALTTTTATIFCALCVHWFNYRFSWISCRFERHVHFNWPGTGRPNSSRRTPFRA